MITTAQPVSVLAEWNGPEMTGNTSALRVVCR
jgi:hypothetical protein